MRVAPLFWLRLWILGVLAVVSIGCGERESSATPPDAPPDVVPDVVPSPAAVSAASQAVEDHLQVVDLAGIESLIAQAAGDDRVLVIDFWATWCVPCVQMFGGLHAGLLALGEGVLSVSVTLDDPTREADAIAFLEKHDALHDAYMIKPESAAQQALADGVGRRWKNLSVPAILVYDRDGVLVGEFLEGGVAEQVLRRVRELLTSDREDQS